MLNRIIVQDVYLGPGANVPPFHKVSPALGNNGNTRREVETPSQRLMWMTASPPSLPKFKKYRVVVDTNLTHNRLAKFWG